MLRRAWPLSAGLLLVAALAGAVAWLTEGPPVPRRDLSEVDGDVSRGAYAARLSGCIACHTDIAAGGAVLAGGPEIETGFGSFYAPSITPHPEDGIGGWTLATFSRALTAGTGPDGEHYVPPFPIHSTPG